MKLNNKEISKDRQGFVGIILVVFIAVLISTFGFLIFIKKMQLLDPQLLSPTPVASPTPSIDSNILSFSDADLKQGWYWGDQNQKKPGTPSTWLLRDSGTKSATWYDPNISIPTPTPILSDTSTSLQTYKNEKYGFKINAPKGWRVDESGLMGTHVIFFNNNTDYVGSIPFVANINVISESAKGLSLNDYIDNSKEVLLKILKNYKITEDKSVKINGAEAYLIGGTFVMDELHLRNSQLIVIKNDKAYVVTGTALESNWDKYKNLFESSLVTFELN